MNYNTKDLVAIRKFVSLLLHESRLTHEEYIELSKPLPIAVPYLDRVIVPKNMDLYEQWRHKQHPNLKDIRMYNMKEVRIKL
jgi:hypothetical protein